MSVKHVFLSLLTGGALHGYDIKQRYDGLMLHETELNFGQVYATLLRMERDGLIALCPGDDTDKEKKVYAITPLGRQTLFTWLAGDDKDSLVLYDSFSYKLAAMQLLGPAQFAGIVEAHRKHLIGELQRLSRKKLETDRSRAGAYLLLERSILKLEADILWCDKCLERLKEDAYAGT